MRQARNDTICISMEPIQSRMARAALKLNLHDLADLAGISRITAQRFEKGDPVAQSTVEAMRHALEAKGVEFTASKGTGRLGVTATKRVTASKLVQFTR